MSAWIRTVSRIGVKVEHIEYPRMQVERSPSGVGRPGWRWFDPAPEDLLERALVQGEALRLLSKPIPPAMDRVAFIMRIVPLINRNGLSWSRAIAEFLGVEEEYLPGILAEGPIFVIVERLQSLERTIRPVKVDEWYKLRIAGVRRVLHAHYPRFMVEDGTWHWVDPRPAEPWVLRPLQRCVDATVTHRYDAPAHAHGSDST